MWIYSGNVERLLRLADIIIKEEGVLPLTEFDFLLEQYRKTPRFMLKRWADKRKG